MDSQKKTVAKKLMSEDERRRWGETVPKKLMSEDERRSHSRVGRLFVSVSWYLEEMNLKISGWIDRFPSCDRIIQLMIPLICVVIYFGLGGKPPCSADWERRRKKGK